MKEKMKHYYTKNVSFLVRFKIIFNYVSQLESIYISSVYLHSHILMYILKKEMCDISGLMKLWSRNDIEEMGTKININ